MPKKVGTNTKAVEARERKQATKTASQQRAAKEAEDDQWEDKDKNLAKKQQRREEEERKKAEAARRKAEAKVMLDNEMDKIISQTQGKQPLAKISRNLLLEELEKKNRAIEAIIAANKQPTSKRIVKPKPIEENLNRAMADTMVATNIDEALEVLSVDDDADKHPEKHARRLFKAFELANMPRIKAENPTLRFSQWNQLLIKKWNGSPENPFNQLNCK